jgi:predicted transcriptional regulator
LAKEFGVTEVTASNALRGKHRRFDIIKRAIEMAKESIAIQRELKETVSELE